MKFIIIVIALICILPTKCKSAVSGGELNTTRIMQITPNAILFGMQISIFETDSSEIKRLQPCTPIPVFNSSIVLKTLRPAAHLAEQDDTKRFWTLVFSCVQIFCAIFCISVSLIATIICGIWLCDFVRL